MAHGPAILTPTSAAEAVELFGNGDDTMVIGGGNASRKVVCDIRHVGIRTT